MFIYPNNPEWNYIKFRIQLITGHFNIALDQVIKSPIEFDTQYQDYIKIDGYINVSGYEEQKIQSIKINNKQNLFQSGYMEQNDNQNQKYRILLYKLAIGQTLPMYKTNSEDLGFPENCDTIYLSENKEQLSVFNHQYKLKTKNQSSLEYDITYHYIESVKFNPDRQTCQYCKYNIAELYCIEDKQFFCRSCYDEIHRSKQKSQHKNQFITPFNSVPKCQIPSHLKQRKNIYCFQCQQIKCNNCIKKQHSSTTKPHQTMVITQLANLFKQKQKNIISEIKSKIHTQIRLVQKKIQTLNKQFLIKEKDLQDKFALRLVKLRQQTIKQLSNISGYHAELRRRYDQFIWVERYLEYCQVNLQTEDNIKMKEAFTMYIQKISAKQAFIKMDRIIQSL